MSTLAQSVAKVRGLLLDPFEQKPTVKQTWQSILFEYQNFANELNLTSQPWSVMSFEVNLCNCGNNPISELTKIGKILFVTTNDCDPVSVEFTDLSDVSTDWWCCNTVDRPYEWYPSNKIAFYRKNGRLYVKSSPQGLECVTVTAATGDWSTNKGLQNSAVLSEYHHLPEIRAALNLLPGAEWSDNLERDAIKRNGLMQSLSAQEARVLPLFREAKRSLAADDVSFRSDGWDDGFYLFG